MSRRRDHRVRDDLSFCPDPEGCARLYHGVIGGPELGDACECCGQEVLGEGRAVPPGEIRSLAVELIDFVHGYTMEFSSSPERREQEYDWAERRITEVLNGRGRS